MLRHCTLCGVVLLAGYYVGGQTQIEHVGGDPRGGGSTLVRKPRQLGPYAGGQVASHIAQPGVPTAVHDRSLQEEGVAPHAEGRLLPQAPKGSFSSELDPTFLADENRPREETPLEKEAKNERVLTNLLDSNSNWVSSNQFNFTTANNSNVKINHTALFLTEGYVEITEKIFGSLCKEILKLQLNFLRSSKLASL